MRQYQKLFEMEGAELEFDAERPAARSPSWPRPATPAPAACASIVEDVMLDIMFELPDMEHKGKYVVTEAVVKQAAALRKEADAGQEECVTPLSRRVHAALRSRRVDASAKQGAC